MVELHKNEDDAQKLEHNEGQRELLCSTTNASSRCPSLCYRQSASSITIDRAFDILFEEVERIERSHGNKTHSDVPEGFDLGSGRATDDLDPDPHPQGIRKEKQLQDSPRIY